MQPNAIKLAILKIIIYIYLFIFICLVYVWGVFLIIYLGSFLQANNAAATIRSCGCMKACVCVSAELVQS